MYDDQHKVPPDAPTAAGEATKAYSSDNDDLRITQLEDVDDLRSTRVQEEFDSDASAQLPDAMNVPGINTRPDETATRRFRPMHRPGTAVLVILDDNQMSGEMIRIRGERCTIGRNRGDVVIPHDSQVSNPHAEIVREEIDGRTHWFLQDLASTNGTYVRAQRVRFKHNDEILVGQRRFRFVASENGNAFDSAAAPAMLVEVTTRESQQQIPLDKDEQWLGRNPQHCPPFLADDMLLDKLHARIFRDTDNRWSLKDAQSVNGVYVRVDKVELIPNAGFQLGEQRFRIMIP